MGFFDTLWKKQKEEAKQAIVPEARLRAIEESETMVSAPKFKVEGIYPLGDQMMVSGKVVAGSFKKGLKLKGEGKEIAVVDVQSKFRKADILNKGDSGALYLKTSGVIIRVGDVITLD